METFSEKAKPGAAIINGDQIKIVDVGFAVLYTSMIGPLLR